MDAPTETASASLDLADTATENGIFAYQAVRRQLQAALDIIRRRMPRRLATPGGECSVNMSPSVTSRPMPGRRAPGATRPGPWTASELPETAQTRTARHDMIVCACTSDCRGAQPGAGGQTHSHLHDQNQKPDIWLIDKCKTIDVGVTLPRQMDHYYNEKLKKYRDGTLPIIYGTAPSLHPKSRRHLEELHVDVEKLSTRAALPPHTWLRGSAST